MRVRTRSIRHRNQRGTKLERVRDLGRHFRERRAVSQALRAIEVSRKIQITQLKPGVPAQSSQRFQASEGVAAKSPTMLRIRETSQRISDGIEIGRDVETMNFGIVGGIADDEDALRRDHSRQSVQKTRGAHTARERDYPASLHNPVILIPDSFTL